MDRQSPQELFLESLDRALDTFGTSVRVVVYYELRKSHGVKREDVPQKLDLFVQTIEWIFGAGSGSGVIARAILRELEASSGIRDLGKKDLLTALTTAYHKRLEDQF